MQIKVKASTLGIDGTAPAAGDEVDFSATGKVTAVEGETATLEVATVNGEPVQADAPAAGEPDDDDLLAEAEKADADAYPKEDV